MVPVEPAPGGGVKILPFQAISSRARKNVSLEDIEIKVCLFAFDLLYLNGKSLINRTFKERRQIMHDTFVVEEGRFMYARHKDATAFDEIEDFLGEAIKDSCEGLMVKTLEENSTYTPSKRSFNWLKLKKDYLDTEVGDSLDLVVVGADWGTGKRKGVYGSFLLACYDEDTEMLQAICKTGTGFSEEDLETLYKRLSELVRDQAPTELVFKEKVSCCPVL